MPNRYMHLLDGKPAYFIAEYGVQMIFHALNGVPADALLVPDLKTIRAQQAKAIEYRDKRGLHPQDYSYLRIKT